MTLNNVYSFYALYAKVDGFKPSKALQEPQSTNILDQWAIARLNQTIEEVTKALENYRLDKAARPIEGFLDDLSNWFVRRSRRRFWKAEDDTDKNQAYETLHYILLRTCQLLAPFSPFLPDHIWRELIKDTTLPGSVHLSDWPSVNKPDNASHKLLEEMAEVRSYIVEGLSQRATAGIKVRQPLAGVTVPKVPEELKTIIADELNVKEVEEGDGVSLNTELTPGLKKEGIARELIRVVQSARKKAGFNIEDRIKTKITSSSNEITEAIEEFKDVINAETLTVGALDTGSAEYTEETKIEAQEVKIALARA
jgi:isoleucyl-tRNA synthetase